MAMLLAAIAASATAYTLVMPMFATRMSRRMSQRSREVLRLYLGLRIDQGLDGEPEQQGLGDRATHLVLRVALPGDQDLPDLRRALGMAHRLELREPELGMAAERVEHEAKRAITAVNEGDMLTTQLAVLKRFGKRAPVDTIALRGKVAAAVQAQDRYPFEGR